MNLWDKVLQHMERRVNPHSFATWFRPTRQERLEGEHMVVRVPTRLFCKRLKQTYGELLQAVLVEIGRPEVVRRFHLRGGGASAAESYSCSTSPSWISIRRSIS